MAVFGGPLTGKTHFIKNLLVRLNECPDMSPREDVYIIDFGGNIGAYSKLGNVCACFDNSNEENIRSVFNTLARRLEENAEALENNSYQYLEEKAPEKCPPHILLIIENLNAFVSDERYAAYVDSLISLSRDGLSKGLSVVVTANDTAGTGRLMSCFGQKLAFDMPADNYYEIFNTKVSKPMKKPGRGLVSIGSGVYEIQCFMPFAEATEEDELNDLVLASGMRGNPNKLMALPKELTADVFSKYAVGEAPSAYGDVILGIDYFDHSPVAMNLEQGHFIAVYGKKKDEKLNFVKLLLNGIQSVYGKVRTVIVDDGRALLKPFGDELGNDFSGSVYLTSIGDFGGYLVKQSYIERKNDTPGRIRWKVSSAETPFTVFVIQSKNFYNGTADSVNVFKIITKMASVAEERNYLFIFSDVVKFNDHEARAVFSNNITNAIVLEDICDFVAKNSTGSVFDSFDPRDLKSQFARCSAWDGFCYNIAVGEDLKKIKFLKA